MGDWIRGIGSSSGTKHAHKRKSGSKTSFLDFTLKRELPQFVNLFWTHFKVINHWMFRKSSFRSSKHFLLNHPKGFSSQYFPWLEFDVTMHVGLIWPIIFNFIIEIMLRSECSWAKGAKPLNQILITLVLFSIKKRLSLRKIWCEIALTQDVRIFETLVYRDPQMARHQISHRFVRSTLWSLFFIIKDEVLMARWCFSFGSLSQTYWNHELIIRDGPIPVSVTEISAYRHIFQYRYRQSKNVCSSNGIDNIGISAEVDIGISEYRQKYGIGPSLWRTHQRIFWIVLLDCPHFSKYIHCPKFISIRIGISSWTPNWIYTLNTALNWNYKLNC